MRPALLLAAAAFFCHGGWLIGRLGFYHDDWSLLANMHFQGGGLLELLREQLVGKTHLFRPLSVVCWTLPYVLFGLKPLGWHLTMAALTFGLGLVFFGILRRLGAPTGSALLGAMLFMAFPNKDATVFWPDCSLVLSTSLLCFLCAYYLHLSYVESGRTTALAGSALLLLASLSAYDQVFFLLPLWLLAPGDKRRVVRGLAAGAAVMAVFVLYKFVLVPRWVEYNKTVRFSARHAVFVYYMAARALLDPRWWLYLARCAAHAVAVAPLLALLGAALPQLARGETAAAPRRLLLWGGALWVLAYLPLTVTLYAPGAYDHMNRLNQLPALGAAAVACWWASTRRRQAALAGLAGLCLVLHTAFADAWARSYERQLEIVEKAKAAPKDHVVLVRPRELYVARKAPVFLSSFDITGALQLSTGEPERRAETYTEWVKAEPDALVAPSGRLPYDKLLLLDMSVGRLERLDHRRALGLPPIVEPWHAAQLF